MHERVEDLVPARGQEGRLEAARPETHWRTATRAYLPEDIPRVRRVEENHAAVPRYVSDVLPRTGRHRPRVLTVGVHPPNMRNQIVARVHIDDSSFAGEPRIECGSLALRERPFRHAVRTCGEDLGDPVLDGGVDEHAVGALVECPNLPRRERDLTNSPDAVGTRHPEIGLL